MLDNTAPVLTAFARNTPASSQTNADTLIFDITFDENVVNVSAGDFVIDGTSATGVLAGSGSAYTLTVSGGDLAGLNGTVGLDLAAGQNITDSVGNALPSGEPATDESYVLDNTPPVLTAFARNTPASSPTNADTLVFDITFDQDVVNVSAGDFVIDGTSATGVLAGSGSAYTLTVSGGDLAGLNGTVGLDLAAGQNITDTAGNALPADEPSADESYLLDNTAPVLTAFARNTPAGSPTNADTLIFDITFDQDVLNVSADDFTISGTTATGVLAGSGSAYTLTVSGGDLAGLNGTVSLDLAAGQNITDPAGNALPGGEPSADQSYVLDNTAPVLTAFARNTPASSQTNADTLIFDITFDENVVNVSAGDFVIDGTSATGVLAGSGSAYTLTVSGGDLAGLNGTVSLDLAAGQNITDPAGNPLPAGEPSADESYVLDNTAPVLTAFARNTPASSPTNADTLVFDITFDQDVVNVSAGDFFIDGTSATGVLAGSGSAYTLTVSGGDLAGLNGTVSLDLAAGQNITDPAGNALPGGEPSADQSYVLDNTAPVLTAFARNTPASSQTNADTLIFDITFDENVVNVTAGDFFIDGTSATGVLAGSGSDYTLTVSGGDLAGLNGTVSLDLAAGQNITDPAGNPLPAGEPSADQSYVLDNTAPVLTAFARNTPASSPTNADTLVFDITFDQDVVNVAPVTFSSTGRQPRACWRVRAATYTLTVSGGDLAGLNGTVGLDLAAGQNITDPAGNPLPAGEPSADESYVLDNTAPMLTAFARNTPASSPTNADTLVFDITFDQDVVNVSAGDFFIDGTSATGVLAGSGSAYTLTVSGGDLAGLNGTVSLDLAAAQNITDPAGNPLPADEPSADESYLLDNTAPVLTAFARNTPASSQTNADTLIFDITFDENVVNVSAGDFVIDGTSATGVLAGSGSAYTLTVSGGDLAGLNGTVGLDLAAAQNITDPAGNALPAGEPTTDETYEVQNDAPSLNSFRRQTPATSPTNADTLVFRATFSEAVRNVDAGDFEVAGSTATITNVALVSAGVYDITVSGGDLAGLNGTVGLDLAAGQNITDTVGNALPGGEPATDESYLLDNTAPVLTAFARKTPASSLTNADTLVFDITFSENVANVTADDFAITGTTATGVLAGSGSAYTLTVSGGNLAGLNGTVGLTLAGGQDITDPAGNALPVGEPSTDESYLLDNTAPVLTAFARNTPASSPTNADTLIFDITFDENVLNVSADDFAISGTTAAGVLAGLGSAYTLTVSGGDLAGLNGTVGLNLAGGQDITDPAGNALPASEPSTDESYLLDNRAPVLTAFARNTPAGSPTNADTLIFDITFDQDVVNVTRR